ncbi:uncharacterized protein YybS (DUF2232 family) [Paenibacillus forsythiae]|uniref:Uncharacterized protein YybS (DUF2232 family) n=1 Tax=Paenibacillus forsythiae TaxID=365616 RepID=A0ABU3H473_9BACL|nr:DUF2232 domain-containing protein [Paenibacillus forsythiae]MDT3425251.1 uncharacterized protein YybS (DUF2232 family) [Paenibacillus forsythiae]
MKYRWTSVAWSIAYLLLLLSLSTPFLIITTLFIIIPVALLFTTLNTRQFILTIVPVWLVLGLISPVYILIAAYLIVPALVMGRRYKKKATASSTILAGTITLLGEFLLLLLLGKTLFQFDLYNYVYDVLNEMRTMALSPMQEFGMGNFLGGSSEDISNNSRAFIQVIPMALIMSSFVITVITHSIVRPILNSMGYAVPKLKPARDWRIPKSFIWYYLIATVIQLLFFKSDNSFMTMITANLVPLLRVCFIIQTIGFFFFIAHERNWNKTIPVILAIMAIMLPPLWIIGIIDLVVPLREMVAKSKR